MLIMLFLIKIRYVEYKEIIMKKRDLFIILLVGVISLIIPKGVFAADLNLQYTPFIDYRFFLEDENENDIENLQFRLHDVNNLISYDSKYDQETKAYYFIDLPSNTFFDKRLGSVHHQIKVCVSNK